MSALGQKRTFAVQKGGAKSDVRFVPIADIASATIMAIKSAGMTIGEIRGLQSLPMRSRTTTTIKMMPMIPTPP